MRVVLCAACGIDDPHAGPLITYLLVHEQVTPENLRECAALIRDWAENITIPPVDLDKLDKEVQAWRQGDL
jgi:hypothetical protein